MQRVNTLLGFGLLIGLITGCATSTEEISYQLIRRADPFELRDYPSYAVAETCVGSSFKQAGNQAFRRLFDYISGKNESRRKIAMTAPVSQKPASEKIAMTAPVGQRHTDEDWMISFTMPPNIPLDTLPRPENPAVQIRQIPKRRIAAVKYSGTWSEKRYRQHLQDLHSWIKKNGLILRGEPVWARYDPPFTLWFLRRNEILIPVSGPLTP